jgi:hypothetical protein
MKRNQSKLNAGISMSHDRMVIKGKPAQVMAVINDMIATHGEDATLREVYATTLNALDTGDRS